MKWQETIGKKFGKLTVLAFSHKDERHNVFVKCLCECGTEKSVTASSIKRGCIKTCGCGRETWKEVIGKNFGRLTALEFSHKNKRSEVFIKFLCECGIIKIIKLSTVKSGKTVSCGCFVKENISNIMRKYTQEEAMARKAYRGHYADGDIPFEIFYKKLSQLPCFYCGAPPNNFYAYFKNKNKKSLRQKTDNGFRYNGLDRLDNTKPHNLDNVVPCCKDCNYAKNDRALQDFIKWIRKVAINLGIA